MDMRPNNLPLTKMKLAVARMLYAAVRLFHRTDERVIQRRGIRYRVNLSEGIDLSLYLFGSFQKHVLESGLARLEPGAVVIDVGANLGQMTLSYAKSPSTARVYAFEPTDYAFSKLQTNLELNPALRQKVVATKAFVSDEHSAVAELTAYSSWPVGGRPAADQTTHPIHGGVVMPASGTPSVTLDEFVEQEDITRVDLIKIDTDGHELQVLRGARRVIQQHQPAIIFEWGQYVLRERGVDPADFFRYFEDFDCRLINLANRHVVTPENCHREIPGRSTTDVLVCFEKGGTRPGG
jgi:FkbM family methyltransferase